LAMVYSKGRQYLGGTESLEIAGGPQALVDLLHSTLLEMGVEFEFNSPVVCHKAGEPAFHTLAGKEVFDKIVIATSPAVYDLCYGNQGLQVGKASFFQIDLKPSFYEQLLYETGLEFASPFGQMYEGSKHGRVKFFRGGPAYDQSPNSLPFELLEVADPGFRKNVLDFGTWNLPNDPAHMGSFEIADKGCLETIAKYRLSGQRSQVHFVNTLLCPEFQGYANGATSVAKDSAAEIVDDYDDNFRFKFSM